MSGDVPERVRIHRLHGADAGEVSDRLLASWRRSEDYGVSLEEIEPAFTGVDGMGSLFTECGGQVLEDLRRTLADEPVSLMLTDADGLVLHRVSGDHALLRALDDVHLAPGFAYSEREVGTNGLGLALADRVPTLVRADQHYAQSLTTFTCAAVPVLDPITGRLEGSVNLTTWAHASSHLLLALARSAASNTSALMLAKSRGRNPRPTPRGKVFRVEAPGLEPGSGTLDELSQGWIVPLRRAEQAMAAGRVVAAVGEPGSGRATLIAQAARHTHPRDRILSATAPAPDDVTTWLGLWTPELGKAHTAVIVCDVDGLPTWVAERLADLLGRAGASGAVPFAVTAECFEDIPRPLARFVDTVVAVPALRERPDDVVPLAAHLATRARGREVSFTAAASRAVRNFGWPGNVDQLARVVTHAARHANPVDVADLPPEVLSDTTRRLSRIEEFERQEIIRVLAQGNPTMQEAARGLGMSRATLYRKISQYGITISRR